MFECFVIVALLLILIRQCSLRHKLELILDAQIKLGKFLIEFFEKNITVDKDDKGSKS